MVVAVTKAAIYCIFAISSSAAVTYDRYEVWRAYPSTIEEVEFMQNLGDFHQIDYWREATIPGRAVDFLVAPNNKIGIALALQSQGINFSTYINNVQDLINNQMTDEKLRQKSTKNLQSILDFDYNNYHDYKEVTEWMNVVVAEFPTIVTKDQFGVTYEGRPIEVLKFRKPGTASKPVVFVDALIHSREWITTASLLYIFKEMLTNPVYEHMMDDADWYFVPMINIDGYVHTWTVDRLWRKTRTSGANSRCNGVDANRNWNSYWAVSGSSDDPCSIVYHGPTPESEPAIRHMAKYIKSVGKIDAFVSTHSYSQLILYPYNYANITTKDQEILDSLGKKMSDAIYSVHGTKYAYGIGATTLYPFSGTTTDWTYDEAGITLSYTFELRDTGEFGFVLPPDQIIPTGEEYLQGLAVLKDEVMRN